jgi:Bacteriophage HK97-gp10, putative tail-component
MDDIGSLLKKFKGVPERLERTLSIAVRMAADEAANEAKANHDYIDRSSNLTNSIGYDGPTGSFRNNDLEAIVSAGAGYAVFVELGTKPHVIKPKYRKALRFPVAGGFVFSKGVKHPGTRARYFLRKAVDKTLPTMVQEHVPNAIELAFVQAGFARGG